MDNYDFAKIDREALRQIEDEAEEVRMSGYEWQYDRWVWNWEPIIEDIDTPPEPLELIPTGKYDGDDLLPGAVILDDSYIVYLEIENPEHNCEVII